MLSCSARLSAIRLLAIRCCLSMLFFSPTAFTTVSGAPAPTTSKQIESTTGQPSDASTEVQKGKCQFDLIDPSSSVEAESFAYQHLGCAHCEYNIRAPGSLVILLNFTDIHSLTDMPVEPGVKQQQEQHQQQEATPHNHPVLNRTHPRGSGLDGGTIPASSAHPFTPSSSTVNQPHGTFTNTNSTERPAEGGKAKDILGGAGSPEIVKLSSDGERNISEVTDNAHNPKSVVPSRVYQNIVTPQTPVINTDPNGDHYHNIVTPQTPVINTDPNGDHYSNIKLLEDRISDQRCSLKLIIEGVNSSSKPQVICWQNSWHRKVPLVYRYSVPVKLTYIWDATSHSGFSLQFSFLQAKDVDCEYHCNNHLCLLGDQLCDGYADCPDGSDEDKTTCRMARQGGHQDSTQLRLILIVSVIIVVLLVLSILMISRRYRQGARRGRGSLLHPPHSQSTEVFRSTSSSMLDSGQYDALVQDSQRHQEPDSAAHCSESHHLLHQQLPATSQCHPAPHRPHPGCQTNLPGELTAGDGAWRAQQMEVSVDKHQGQHHPNQQHQQQHQKQQRKQPVPHELYPPHIAVSGDGEEGYASAQRSLHSKQQQVRNWRAENEVFRPPPNRTVFDCDYPPPPYSLSPPGMKSSDSAGVVDMLRPDRGSLTPDSSPTSRCHSLSYQQ